MSEWPKRKLDPSAVKLIESRGDLSPDLWAQAIREQQARVTAASTALSEQAQRGGMEMTNLEPFRRVRYEGHFLLVAIAHVLKIREVFFDLTHDARLAEAQQQFDAAAPDAKHLRDMLEHMDRYAFGTGRLQVAGEVDKNAAFQIITLMINTGRVRFRFDKEVDLEAAASAALEVAAVAAEVRRDHVDQSVDN
jgi:hypothetical protein